MPVRSSALVAGVGADRLGDAAELDRAGVAVEQCHAVEEERRGERAEQEVLERGLLAEQPPAARQPAEQVERQRQHLERDEHREQVVRRREEQHPADREHQQREDLGLGDAGRGEHPLVPRAGHGRAGWGEDAAVVGGALGSRRARRGSRAAGSCPAGTASARRSPPTRRRRSGARPASVTTETKAAISPASERHQLGLVPPGAAHEGLDEHADHGDAEHDEHRHQQPVLDVRCLEGCGQVRPAVLEASVAPITSRSLRRPAPAARGR